MNRPDFDNQFVVRSRMQRDFQRQGGLVEPQLGDSPPGSAKLSYFAMESNSESLDAVKHAQVKGPQDPAVPEPGPWLAELLQQRKEMKS